MCISGKMDSGAELGLGSRYPDLGCSNMNHLGLLDNCFFFFSVLGENLDRS